jgi:hypothetical protein
MHIYISDGETEIEGSVSELRNVSEYIKRAKTGSIKYYELSQVATAEPYDSLLEQLILNCNDTKIKGSLSGNILEIEFSEETADVMASYFEFEEGFEAGYHCHFDQYGNEEYFDVNSIDMVVQVAHKKSL